MDLFKRIKDLSAVYDDDGPSAMVPESRNMAQSERTNFVLGGPAIQAMKATAKTVANNLNRIPTQNELVQATGKAAATIKKYFKEGIDYLKPMDKKEAAKLGGKKPTGITTVSDDLVQQFKDLKATHISPSVETSKAGSKLFRVKFSGPIKNDFKNIAVPATKENLKIIKKQVDDVVSGNLYKNKAKVFHPENCEDMSFENMERYSKAMIKKAKTRQSLLMIDDPISVLDTPDFEGDFYWNLGKELEDKAKELWLT